MSKAKKETAVMEEEVSTRDMVRAALDAGILTGTPGVRWIEEHYGKTITIGNFNTCKTVLTNRAKPAPTVEVAKGTPSTPSMKAAKAVMKGAEAMGGIAKTLTSCRAIQAMIDDIGTYQHDGVYSGSLTELIEMLELLEELRSA